MVLAVLMQFSVLRPVCVGHWEDRIPYKGWRLLVTAGFGWVPHQRSHLPTAQSLGSALVAGTLTLSI